MAARSSAAGGRLGRLKSAVVQRVVGVIVLVVTTTVVGLVRMGIVHLGGGGSEDSTLIAKDDAVRSSAPAATGRASTRGASGMAAIPPADGDPLLDAPAEEPVDNTAPVRAPAQGSVATRLASASGTRSAAVTAVTPDAPKAGRITHVDEHVTYQYNALGRRDPFQSLINGEFVGADVGGDAPPDPGGIKVVGIVWGATDQFAMVEDVRGNSYVLRKGDKVQNGYVEALRREAVVVNVTADGQSQQVVIPLTRKGDSNAR